MHLGWQIEELEGFISTQAGTVRRSKSALRERAASSTSSAGQSLAEDAKDGEPTRSSSPGMHTSNAPRRDVAPVRKRPETPQQRRPTKMSAAQQRILERRNASAGLQQLKEVFAFIMKGEVGMALEVWRSSVEEAQLQEANEAIDTLLSHKNNELSNLQKKVIMDPSSPEVEAWRKKVTPISSGANLTGHVC